MLGETGLRVNRSAADRLRLRPVRLCKLGESSGFASTPEEAFMLIGVPLETAAGESRVAVTPETVKKLKAQGHTVKVQSGAGVAASVTDEAYVAAGAEITDQAGAFGCELVLKVRAPVDSELSLMRPRRRAGRHAQPLRPRQPRPHGRRRHHELRARGRAAHHARAEHGRAELAGQHRRLQGRDDRGRPLPALLPDADDRRRHREGRAGRDPRRGCRRACRPSRRPSAWAP